MRTLMAGLLLLLSLWSLPVEGASGGDLPWRCWQERSPRVAVLCALPWELGSLVEEMSGEPDFEEVGRRSYHRGELWGFETVLAESRVGKVAAATTVTHLIEREGVDLVIFIGVAGAMDPRLHQGDVVIGERLIQHDLDCRPLSPRYTVPLTEVTEFASPPSLVVMARDAARDFMPKAPVSGGSCVVYQGLIGTGDQFVADSSLRESIREGLPDILAVDMEGAAVAQVCYEYGVPCLVVRTISDACDENSGMDCREFLRDLAPQYTHGILRELYEQLRQEP